MIMIELINTIAMVTNQFVLFYFIAINFGYTVLLILSAIALVRHKRALHWSAFDLLLRDEEAPGVGVVMPVHNEEAGVAIAVRAVLNLNYPNFEVIVVNDGSKDSTMAVLKEKFRLVPTARFTKKHIDTKPVRAVYRSLSVPSLSVIDKENGGKADSINAGINACRMPYVCAIDGDVILEQDALLRIMQPISQDPERIAAIGGIVRVANGCLVKHGKIIEPRLPKEALPMFQVVEYMRAFLSARTGLPMLNALPLVSGAFGVFAHRHIVAVGGFNTSTVGEDMEIICAIHEKLKTQGRDYRILFAADPVCWTEVPSSMAILGNQRRRWHRGLMETLSIHKKMIFNPRFGALGVGSLPFFYFFEGWGPIVELLGYFSFAVSIIMGWVDYPFALTFLTMAVAWGILLSLCSVLMDEFSFRRYTRWNDMLRMVLYAFLENLGYRQLNTLFRVQGLWKYLTGAKGWGEMTRTGLGS
ncbi:glycosyltransferase [Elusimicrobiota bacterium]